MKKVVVNPEKRKKRTQVKYPKCSTFHTKSKKRSIFILPQHEISKIARNGGKIPVNGFNHLAKVNINSKIFFFIDFFNFYKANTGVLLSRNNVAISGLY